MGPLVGLFLLNVAFSTARGSLVNYCTSAQPPEPTALSSKMKLPTDYKLEGTLSDWIKKNTAYFTEHSINGRKSITVTGRSSTSRFVQLDSQFYSVNNTDCLPENNPQPFGFSKNALTLLNATTVSSISDLFASLINYSTINKGVLNSTAVVAGIEGVLWVSCFNGTDKKPVLQVEVVYADNPGSFNPASTAFSNPQLMFLRLSEFDSGGNFSNAISLSIDKRTDSTESLSAFQIPNGVLCEGRNATPLTEITYPDPVNILVQNSTDNTTFELFYSPSKSLAIVQTSGTKKDSQVPFFKTPANSDGTTFIHDYYSGYEYVTDSRRCLYVNGIPESSAEAKKVDEKYYMKVLNDTLLQSSSWQKYDSIYRTRGANGEIIELEKNGNQVLIKTYVKGKLETSVNIITLSSTATPNIFPIVRNCYANQGGDAFRFILKNKRVNDVLAVGEETVVSSLAETLASIGPINKFRVKAAFSNNSSNDLDVIINISEKNDKSHVTTNSSLDRSKEVSLEVFFTALNKTVNNSDWSFNVEDKVWTATKGSLSKYPLPPPPSPPEPFQGYTGGSMFILGLFSLVFGAAIGAGALFFITRRQRISTLAYQVFE